MPAIEAFLTRLEASPLAATIQSSLLLNGVLSGLHLLGLTLLLGSVGVTSCRLFGLLGDYPAGEVTQAPRGGALIGVIISLTTGFLLVAPRAVSSWANPTFRLKMSLLLAALAFQLTVQRRAAQGRPVIVPPGLVGGVAVALWTGVALAGCAFILLE